MHIIRFVRQPTLTSCMHACMAMITGREIEDVFRRMGEDPFSPMDAIPFLVENRIFPIINADTTMTPFATPGVYLCSVPSLNRLASLHAIVAVVYDWPNHEFEIFDPVKGWEGKKFYQREDFINGSGCVLSADIMLHGPLEGMRVSEIRPSETS